MPNILNFTLLKNPANWFIVWLILLIGALAVHVIYPPKNNS